MSPTHESPTMRIEPWPEPLIDRLGHDPRSAYVELYWLPILGPTCTWLLRRVAARFDDEPEGFDLDTADTARALGLGSQTGRHSVLMRSLRRLCTFKAAHETDDAFLVRRRLAPLTRSQASRLPEHLQRRHEAQTAQHTNRDARAQRTARARRLALTLFELGEDVTTTERHLHLLTFHPETSREAAVWAHQRHTRAAAAAEHAQERKAS